MAAFGAFVAELVTQATVVPEITAQAGHAAMCVDRHSDMQMYGG